MKMKYNIDQYDPLIALADISQEPNLTATLRVDIHKAILPYVHTQRKAVMLSGDPDGEPIEMKMNMVDKIVAALEGEDEEDAEETSTDPDA